MLIKRIEKENIVEAFYNSSNILASKWDKGKGSLIITFKRGAQYVYHDVKPTDYVRFEIDESQGVIFNSHIKPNYRFDKLNDINPDEVINRIEEIKNEEIKNAKLELIDYMKTLVDITGAGVVLDDSHINGLELLILNLKEVSK